MARTSGNTDDAASSSQLSPVSRFLIVKGGGSTADEATAWGGAMVVLAAEVLDGYCACGNGWIGSIGRLIICGVARGEFLGRGGMAGAMPLGLDKTIGVEVDGRLTGGAVIEIEGTKEEEEDAVEEGG